MKRPAVKLKHNPAEYGGWLLQEFADGSCTEPVGRHCGADAARPMLARRGLITLNFTVASPAAAAAAAALDNTPVSPAGFRATLYFAGNHVL